MQGLKLKILPIGDQEDLTIIFEDKEGSLHKIKTSKEEFLGKLRYFKQKANEIHHTNAIYIKEDVKYDIFANFINSIKTHEIEVDDSNYEHYYKLSQKYEYAELLALIQNFIENRPDINRIIEEYSNNSEDSEPNFEKEEILSKNLDFSIQNGNLHKLPLEMLNRILNSPKRNLKDHHLLFNFVIGIIEDRKMMKSEEENLLLLPSCLDYLQMTDREIEKLFSIEERTDFFKPLNIEARMKIFIEESNQLKSKFEIFEQQQKEKENGYIQRISKLENQLEIVFDFMKKYEENEKMIQKQIDEQNEFLLLNKTTVNEMKSFEQKTSELIEKNSQEQKLLKLTVDNINEKLNEVQLKANSIECKKGIFQYLFDSYKSNPVDQGLVEISGNSEDDENNKKIINMIIDPNFNDKWWVSQNEENSFFQIEFKKSIVLIDKYKLRVGNRYGKYKFTSWTLTGVTENGKEIVLDDVNSTKKLSKAKEATFSVQNHQYVQSVKLTMKGLNDCGDHVMDLGNIELYGLIR
ncbi:hypothetical protein M9Y10_017320 [Tritrichomonas musculus]|uniref:BTB domain-containing protein n=1 Tax=Tritrichomonas musculus TaxID=1915356 RepID=A0ABR2HTG4_9EUKA